MLNQLQGDGFTIHTMATPDGFEKKLVHKGFDFTPINFKNNTTNPIKDILLTINYIRLYKKISPDIILQNAIKPNIYGTIAAGILGIPVINNVSGLGTLFIKKSFSTYIGKALYFLSQKFATVVLFQNESDKELFIYNNLIDKERAHLIPGSGVDTKRFSPETNCKVPSSNFRFLFIGRLLVDKGILEYIKACDELKNKFENVEFNILGPFYNDNSSGITESDLQYWVNKGTIKYLGVSNDVIQNLRNADCLVLPSYREGLSKVLLEASSMEVPIITTNVPGCKDVIKDNFNGLLCEPEDYIDLKNKMEKMFLLSPSERSLLGSNARRNVVDNFEISFVIQKYRSLIELILLKSSIKNK